MDDSSRTTTNELVVLKRYEPNVRERQIDFLLEEEISCNRDFLLWLIGMTGVSHSLVGNPDVRRSVCDEFGEADVQFTYTNEDGRRIALLIEDKIGAVFQSRQAERYKQRGEAGIAAKRWESYQTCLIAPNSYISHGHAFDSSISLENLSKWFVDQGDSRSSFKSKIILDAIVKASITGAKIVDPIMTEFRRRYFFFFQDFFRERRLDVRISPPADVYAGEAWWKINSGLLPRGVYIHHKAPKGFVDLTFSNTTVDLLEKLELIVDPSMNLAQTGKSSAVRLQVSKIEAFNNFDCEEARVSESLQAVCRLLSFFVDNRGRFEKVLNKEKTNDAPQVREQERSSGCCTWVERTIDPQEDYFELSFGSCSNDCDAWIPIARVGQQSGKVFGVEYLLSEGEPGLQNMRNAVTDELNLYLIEKRESDPWEYLKYHCGTAANLYSSVHWAFHGGKQDC